MVFNPLLGFDPERLTCGMPVWIRDGRVIMACSSALVAWVPVVHVRLDEDRKADVGLGALAMCGRCRRSFAYEQLEKLPIWRGVLDGFREEWGTPDGPPKISGNLSIQARRPVDIRRKHVEIEFVPVADFLKQHESL